MNNKGEIYKALIDGETMKAFLHSVKLVENVLIDTDSGRISNQAFEVPSNWQIYKEPKWYENIPEGGVLCLCNDGLMVQIKWHEDGVLYKMAGNTYTLDFVKPLTKQEIQVFMDNAPEAE